MKNCLQRKTAKIAGFTVIAATMMLMACSAKIEGGGDNGGGSTPAPVNNGFFDSKPTIAGPAVEGSWKSACALQYDKSARFFEITFKDETVIRTENTFSDSKCQTRTKQIAKKGRFRFIEHFADDGYEIEYAFDEGGGVTSFPQEKVKLMQGRLFIGNFNAGEFAQVLEAEGLDPVGATPTPTPTPTPQPQGPSAIDGILASSKASAKFIYCNVGGYGYLYEIKAGYIVSGNALAVGVSYKQCNVNEAFTNLPDKDFFVSYAGDYLTFSSSNLIEMKNNLKDEYAYIGGRGGSCTFLTNRGIKNVDTSCK